MTFNTMITIYDSRFQTHNRATSTKEKSMLALVVQHRLFQTHLISALTTTVRIEAGNRINELVRQ